MNKKCNEKFSNTKIETARLILRPIKKSDFFSTCRYALDKSVTKYMIYLHDMNIFKTFSFLKFAQSEWNRENPRDLEFAIILKEKNIHIGAIDIEFGENGEIELGWILNSRFQKKGFCTEAATALLDWAKKNFEVKKIIAHCDEKNLASQNVMKKLGLVQSESKGERIYSDGRISGEVEFCSVL